MTEGRCLLVFTKPARPGRVKTRLIGELTAIEAARLHAAFIADLLARTADREFDVRTLWAVDPGEPLPSAPVPSFEQQGGDLGERLYFGLRQALRSYPVAVAVGSDHPDLPIVHLETAFAALEKGADLVLGPALDGGYYLIGARPSTLSRALFRSVPWSTEQVFTSTLANARKIGLGVEVLPAARDVDTADDLHQLAAKLAGEPDLCPTTYDLLATWNRVPAPQRLESKR